jgi:hypothetical protein
MNKKKMNGIKYAFELSKDAMIDKNRARVKCLSAGGEYNQ